MPAYLEVISNVVPKICARTNSAILTVLRGAGPDSREVDELEERRGNETPQTKDEVSTQLAARKGWPVLSPIRGQSYSRSMEVGERFSVGVPRFHSSGRRF